MKPDLLSKPLKDTKMESIYGRLSEVAGHEWGVSFHDVDEGFGCSIQVGPYGRMGLGDTPHEALTEAAKLWGMTTPKRDEAPLPPPPAPKPPEDTTTPEEPPPAPEKKPTPTAAGKIWSPERTEKMREIKAKLRMTDVAQLGIHLETWSKGQVQRAAELTADNVDSFLKYMYDKYINRINSSGLDDPGVGRDVQGELF